MPATFIISPTPVEARRLDHADIPALDVLGPVLRTLVPEDGDGPGFHLFEASFPPGAMVPLHSHADRELFLMLSGRLEAWNGTAWATFQAGDILDVRDGAPHAWRNSSGEAARLVVVTTPALAGFLRELALPVAEIVPGPPPPERLRHFLETAARHGYWIASPEENHAIGLALG